MWFEIDLSSLSKVNVVQNSFRLYCWYLNIDILSQREEKIPKEIFNLKIK